MRRLLLIGTMMAALLQADLLENGQTFSSQGIPAELTADLNSGQSIQFTLHENMTTGYSWEITVAAENCPVDIQHKGPERPNKNEPILLGAPGKAVVTITPTAPGSHLIQLKYMRSFEPIDKAVHTIQITINARKSVPEPARKPFWHFW